MSELVACGGCAAYRWPERACENCGQPPDAEYVAGARVHIVGLDGVPSPEYGGEVVRAWFDADEGVWRYYVRWDVGHAGACTGRILAPSTLPETDPWGVKTGDAPSPPVG